MIIGVSPDPPGALSDFREEYRLSFMLLSDTDHKVSEAYGGWTRKKLYGKTYFGIVRSHYVIDETGKVVDFQYDVSPAESVERAVAVVVGD